jgi:hypothetical protein
VGGSDGTELRLASVFFSLHRISRPRDRDRLAISNFLFSLRNKDDGFVFKRIPPLAYLAAGRQLVRHFHFN